MRVPLYLLLCCVGAAGAFCPSQCTCVFHGRSDGTGTRSVLCNDPDMSDIPVNVPVDTVKLRVEKTAVRRIPTEAFYYLADLRYLWITYNSISSVDTSSFYNLKVLHELRLDGNLISVFPWEALKEMPSLRTLDLHNNRLTTVPSEAVPYLVNITYLDLSSNKLSTLPSDLMDIWPPFNKAPVSNSLQKIVLGLQDNPWFCDCKISKLIEMSRMADSPVVLMDLFLTCTAPDELSGVLFQRAELENCVKPSVMTSATKITSPLGSNVLLRCDAAGLPTPALSWVRPDGAAVDNTVEESPGEGVRWSIMSLTGIMNKDAGNYSCKAKNVAGDAEAAIFVSVAGALSTTLPPPMPDSGTESSSLSTTFTPTADPVSVTPTSPILSSTDRPRATTPGLRGSLQTCQDQTGGSGKRLAADQKGGKDPAKSVTDVRVVEEAMDSAVLLWTADGLSGDTPLTVVFSPYGEDDSKQTLETSVSRGKELLQELLPGTRYSVCLVVKGSASAKDPCVDFYTLDSADDSRLEQLFMIVSGIACALIVPLIALLVYKILALYCKGPQVPVDEEELGKESYVKFETISMKHRTLNSHPTELWARRPTHDSERMLLCSRSSIDSQTTYKSDSSRSEYLC